MKVLIVDDESDILEIVSYNLESAGYEVYTASNGIEGIALAKEQQPQLIILDVMMPGMDGIETCEKLRALPQLDQTIIAFFTARGEDYSQMAGFEAGADDYITKPIKPKILVSKVKSLLRRFNTSEQKEESSIESIQLSNLEIDREQYEIKLKGKVINLPRKEFELLALLASKPNKVFTREAILDHVWGNDVVVGGRTIDVHIRKLREKIGDKRFKTVKGVGYKFVEK
ncbi:MAG: response regulator transcription factor [Flavobacteriaceae bacterium]|nr:response regulator transcription factor [Flavobacteriaceae bacterium]NVJ71695.1 response regulator transcription factor [Flavobacteriaceae bacterium]